MRFRSLHKWTNPKGCVGLLYFAQLMEELIFDYSNSTYKYSVMHSPALAIEAVTVLKEIEKGNIRPPNLNHICAELADNIDRDIVAINIITIDKSSYIGILKNPKSKPSEIKPIIELLAIQLARDPYLKKNIELLVQEIENQQDLMTIRRLARSFITALIAMGHSQTHIEKTTLEYFYLDNGNKINSPSDIRGYIDRIIQNERDYKYIFRVSKLFDEAKAACLKTKIEIEKTLPDEIAKLIPSKFSINSNLQSFAILENIKARDIYSGRDQAEKKLSLAATLLNLYHHKESPTWENDSIVYLEDLNSVFLIKNPSNVMQKCADNNRSSASSKLSAFLSEFWLEENSFIKFIRSTQLHALALKSNSEENQIINLWIALESLIPFESRNEDDSNIEHIINSLIPFHGFTYVRSLVNTLVKDLLHWDHKITRQALKKVAGKKFNEKMLRVLVLPEYKANLDKIRNNTKDFHLLKTRIDYLVSLLENPKKIINTLEHHRQRLEWQFRRIYRVRNIIVHTGATPPYTKHIIPHAHEYLDLVLNSLIKLATEPRRIYSVSQGFKYVELKYRAYIGNLNEANLTLNTDNIEKLVFDDINLY